MKKFQKGGTIAPKTFGKKEKHPVVTGPPLMAKNREELKSTSQNQKNKKR